MTWTADPGKTEARNEHGYKLTWAHNQHGTWFNAWSPRGQHVDSGHDQEIVKAMCEMHREKLEKARAVYHAKKLERA